MLQLTVGYVAGFIAAAIFVVRVWAPTALTFILSSVLRDTNTAATWSVAARALQRSHWPTLLQSDSVKTHAVRKDVVFLTWVISVMGALTAIAGIVTPLGLYQALLPDDPVSQSFNFIKDNSPFGLGTPDRSNLSFTRICGYYPVIPCPFTDTVAIIERNATDGTIDFPYGYDINMPAKLEEIFSSGTDDTTTVSNYFDIQWRRYQTTTDELFNNGSRYLVGAFRPMQSLALDNSLQPVEGLVVDMVNGGIGFRNHTVPPGFEFGVTWEEDLLFIEPETACADTNTTLDYKIAASPNATATIIIDLVLTDRGGFVNLNHTYPDYNMTAPQTNADLAKRAYKAAWLVNAYTMLYYNITNMANQTLGTHAFRYVNSAINKTFQVPVYSGQANYYTSLGMDPSMDFHLYFNGSIANTSSPADSGPPSNPFNVDDTYFNEIGISCKGSGGADYANMTNILVNCGVMRGVPRRIDPGPITQFDSASQWSQPLYACATAIKASAKTVSFTYNGTAGLQSLNITGIRSKNYTDVTKMPLWGVENTGNAYTNADLSVLWGLISPQYANHSNVSAIRQPHLYLPGFTTTLSSLTSLGAQNLPASDFYSGAVGEVYNIGTLNARRVDYSGQNSMAMWVRWQNLTASAKTASLIPNLVWTDYAAAAVVGSKGVLGRGNTAAMNTVALKVVPTVSKIQYHWPFAIPALLVALFLILITLGLIVAFLFGGGRVAIVKTNLKRLSPGRILASLLYPDVMMNMAREAGGNGEGIHEWMKVVVSMDGEVPVGRRDVGGSDNGIEMMNPMEKRGVYVRAPSGSVEAFDGMGGHEAVK